MFVIVVTSTNSSFREDFTKPRTLLYKGRYMLDQVFKNGPSKICGTQALKNLN